MADVMRCSGQRFHAVPPQRREGNNWDLVVILKKNEGVGALRQVDRTFSRLSTVLGFVLQCGETVQKKEKNSERDFVT
jgi:hypothetical protein